MSVDAVKWDEPIIDGTRLRWRTTLNDGTLDEWVEYVVGDHVVGVKGIEAEERRNFCRNDM